MNQLPDIDDMKVIMFCLKHKCEKVKSLRKAVKVIVKETGFKADYIKSVIKFMYRLENKKDNRS